MTRPPLLLDAHRAQAVDTLGYAPARLQRAQHRAAHASALPTLRAKARGRAMIDGSQRVEFDDVVVVWCADFVVMCCVAMMVVPVPTRCMLPGTTILTADSGRLVFLWEVALNIRL